MTNKEGAASGLTTSGNTKPRPPTTKRKAGAIVRAKKCPPPAGVADRDHVARCIVREIKEGRGKSTRRCHLDIAWIKKKKRISNGENQIRRKLRACITRSKNWRYRYQERADGSGRRLYVMGGIRFDSATQMSARSWFVRGGRMRRGDKRSESAGRKFAL